MEWQLQDAKNHFSKVVQSARTQGPQIVTLRGERAAVVLSARDYDALTASRPMSWTISCRVRSGTRNWPRRSTDAPRRPAAMRHSDVSRRHQCRLGGPARLG